METARTEKDGGREERRRAAPRRRRTRRSRALAAGVVIVFPGLGHVYARSPWSAPPIALTVVFGYLFLGVTSGAFLGTALLGAYVADLIGAQIAVTRWNRGLDTPPEKQLLHGLAAALIVVGAALLVHVLASSSGIPG